jgi:hypothetical protein
MLVSRTLESLHATKIHLTLEILVLTGPLADPAGSGDVAADALSH